MNKNSANSGKKVALGMSGGVDSSLCAHLLIEQGYEVAGVYLECWKAPGCRSEEDRKDALKIALDLGIPFKVLDFKDAYKQKVVEYFFARYQSGSTPNPDVMCNKKIKFGLFYDWAMQEDYDFIATGHYAQISTTDGEKQLAIPRDGHKDQTYFLYLLKQEQLAHTLFPLSTLTKKQVREQAEKKELAVAHKKDSVGICFIGDINVHQFLKERLGENPGEVIDTSGTVIGKHLGLWFYTVGQRSGFEIQAKTVIKQEDGTSIDKHNIPPFYVIKKIAKTNQLVVGFGSETFFDSFAITEPHWIVEKNEQLALENNRLLVRVRHTGDLLPCTLIKYDTSNKYGIKLHTLAKGIAEGQSAVLYLPVGNTTLCLGGGIISPQ